MSEFEKELAKEIVSQTAGQAYNDLIHPTAESIGNILSLLPRTVGVWLSGLQKWVINGEESIRLTAEAVKEKASLVPEDKLTEPEPYVAVPTIQQLSYCYDSEELRELYANLLVSSMNIDTKYNVHPAYVEIIKQLSPNEALIINYMYNTLTVIPVMNFVLKMDDGGIIDLLSNFTYCFNEICNNYPKINQLLDNLQRLGIIRIRFDQRAIPDSQYDSILNSDKVCELFQHYEDMPNSSIITEYGVAELSDFGRSFCKICCKKEV